EHSLADRGCGLLLSPAAATPGFDPEATPANLAEWLLETPVRARLQLQLHKIIWPCEFRGR
ncbi:MAG: hypothetical protein GXP32_08365, partial [Kiritimatiellaeota bacterium]|nr:hypothetical protein [Kiritimatiellota bacterium]